jgi:hypothetical protein
VVAGSPEMGGGCVSGDAVADRPSARVGAPWAWAGHPYGKNHRPKIFIILFYYFFII